MILCVSLMFFSQIMFGMEKTIIIALLPEHEQKVLNRMYFFEDVPKGVVPYNGIFQRMKVDGQACHALTFINPVTKQNNYILLQKGDQTAISLCARKYCATKQSLMFTGESENKKLGISFVKAEDETKRIFVYPDYHNAICFLDDARENFSKK